MVNGNIYTGDFKEGKKNGRGMEKYANGDFYEGDYVQDFMQGEGFF